MKRIMPDFHGEFRCIGGSCTDNCCISWEIDIDRAAMEKYRAMDGDFGEMVRRNIEGEPPHFRLAEGGRCVLLDENNLCRLILHGGEEMLCEICDQHPRFRGQYGDRLEIGAGLCCEVAARQWLCGEGKIILVEEEIPSQPPRMTKEQAQRLEALVLLRARMLEILAGDAPLNDRLLRILALGEGAQQAMDAGKPRRIASLAEKIPSGGGTAAELDAGCIALLRHMEPIDAQWTDTLEELEARLPEIREKGAEIAAKREDAYARLAMYGLYRYMLKAVSDGDVLGRVKWAILAVWIVRRMDALNWLRAGGEWSDALDIDAAKLFSKQVEYSQENMTLMLSECWNSMHLSIDRIAGALLQ